MYDTIRGQMIADEIYSAVKEKAAQMFGDSVQVLRQNMMKANVGELDGLTFKKEGSNIAATLYLNPFVERIEAGEMDTEEAATALFGKFLTEEQKNVQAPKITFDFENAKQSLYCVALSKSRNEELLKGIPTRDVAGTDLTLVMRWKVDSFSDENAKASFLVRNEHLSSAGLTDAEAFEIAIPNTLQFDPISIETMRDVMRKMGVQDEMLDMMDGPEMLIVRNESGINGATGIFIDKQVRAQVAEYFKETGRSGEFFILPSSTEEVICVPAEEMDAAQLERMICDVNDTQVAAEDQLGDVPYFCNDKLQLSMPTMTDNEALSDVASTTENVGAHL